VILLNCVIFDRGIRTGWVNVEQRMGKIRKVSELQLGSSSKVYIVNVGYTLLKGYVFDINTWYLHATRLCVVCINLSKEQSCAGLKMAMRYITQREGCPHTCITEYQWRVLINTIVDYLINLYHF